MNKPKLLFIFDTPYSEDYLVGSGLFAALFVLEKDFAVTKFNFARGVTHEFDTTYDFVLGWGGFSSSVDAFIQSTSFSKKGLCIAGNAFPPKGAFTYDVLFYETKWYRPQINFHKNIVQAFGINSDLFDKPTIPMQVVWDYIGVGSLANWKRWERMTEKKGRRLVVGEYQAGNEAESGAIAQNLLKQGVMVSPQVNPYDLVNYYYWSRMCYIPADLLGGGERSVLEARACGLTVEVADDNPKLAEVLAWNPIPNHLWYAKQLKIGIESCL